VVADLKAAMESRPGYRLLIVGHSLGGGTAAMLTMMLREQGGLFAEASCIAVACPACMTLELAKSCSGYVTTIINAADVIPTICPGSADLLREEVMQSSWFADFRQDMRASRIVKVVESSLTRVTTVTATATSWTSARLSACYPRRQPLASAPPRPTLKRRNSDEGFATPSWHDRTVEDVSALSPLSSSAPERGPAGLGLATRLPAPLRSWNWTEGVTQLTSFTGRQAQSLGKTMSRLTATTSSSGHGLLGAWGGQVNENNAASQENENSRDYKSMDVAAAATQGSPPLSTDYVTTTDMQQRRAHDPGENSMVDDDCGDDDDDDYSNLEALGLAEEDEEGLEAEMAARMQDVRRAVRAAEAEENALQSQGNAHDPVPAIIRPGNYGECDQSSSYPSNFDAHRSGDHATAWQRQMYPAGRILHLIPAHLMHGLEKNGPHGHSKRDSTSEQCSAVAREDRGMVGVDANVTGCSKRALTDMDGYHQPGTLPTKARVVAGAAGSDTMMVYIENELGSSAAPMESGHARHVSEISMGEVVTAEEATGSARPGATGERGPLPPLKPARGPPEPMVLLEGVPQECYARIRLCRTVLSDHVIPNYLRSLESFVDKLRGT
jgi:pimeloyl-ACP methyl ester carboxylesterase